MNENAALVKPSYLFRMVPLQKQCYFSLTEANFQPQLRLFMESTSTIPIFLRDHKYYTPAFVLPRDKVYYTINNCYEKQIVEDQIHKACKLHQNLKEITGTIQLEAPIPSSNYCQICKIRFNQYFEHIKNDQHQEIMKTNNFSKFIMELQKKIKKDGRKKKRKSLRIIQKNQRLIRKVNKPISSRKAENNQTDVTPLAPCNMEF